MKELNVVVTMVTKDVELENMWLRDMELLDEAEYFNPTV